MKKTLSIILTLSIIFSLCSSFVIVRAEDMIFFDSFEEGYEKNWTLYGTKSEGKVNIAEDKIFDGKKALHIIDDVEGSTTGVKGPMIDIKAGETYTASAFMRAVSGKNLRIFFRFYDADNKQLGSKAATPEGDIWQSVFVTLQAPEGALTCQIIVAGLGSLMGEVYMDYVAITKGEEPLKDPNKTDPSAVKDGELIYSDSFEDGFAAWSFHTPITSELAFLENEIVYDGKKSVKILDPDTSGPGIKSPLIEIAPGSIYTASSFMYLKEGSGLKMFFRFYDKDKKQLESKSVENTVGSWMQAIIYLPAPENARYCQFVFAGLGQTIGELYVDKVELYKGVVKFEKEVKNIIPPLQSAPVDAKIVTPVNNKLVYTPYSDKGDILGDYSYAGFYNGAYQLPESKNIPVAMEVSPTGTKDDTKMLQDAIDKVSLMAVGAPMKILKLKEGKYYINKTGLKMKSGVVLSGSGQGPTGTNLYAFEPEKYTVVSFFGEEVEAIGDKLYLTDSYIPSGSKTIHVSSEDAKKLSVGDEIMITANSTDEWAEKLEMLGMVDIYGGDSSWHAGKIPMLLERTITGINDTEITLDFGVHMPYMCDIAPMYINIVADDGRIENAGVENLRIESYYNGLPTDENHANNAVTIARSKNIFVRDITAKHFSNYGVSCQYKAKQITIQNCSYIEPICASGSAKRYGFTTSRSSQLLYTGCYTNDALIAYGTGYPCTGPVSFVDNVNDNGASTTETHGTWSTAVMFDNIYHIPNDVLATISLANNGKYGTASTASQGWTSASAVAWNCLASAIVVHDVPLGYENFGIGVFGRYLDDAAKVSKDKRIERTVVKYKTSKIENCPDSAVATDDETPFVGDGYFEAKYTPVNPRSLFKAQLSERITGVISNARPNAPMIYYPEPEKVLKTGEVQVTGLYQLGAGKVTVYIDNIPYDATLGSDNTYSLKVNLEDGVHKIFVTQTIDGVEGNKNADRFITVGEANGNPEYLESIYPASMTTLLANDPRPTFDKIANDIKVFTDGDLLMSDVSPFETNGRVLVPMRAIFEKLRADVSWDGETSTATAVKDGTEVKITENATTAYVNGNPVTLDVPATILNGRFVVPVRFISESFGAEVGWIDEYKAVTIASKKDNGEKTFNGEFKGNSDNTLTIYSVTQNMDDGYGSSVDNILDGSRETLWLAQPDKDGKLPFAVFDLGESKALDSINIAFYMGKSRVYTFSIYVSDDNVNFTPVIENTTNAAKSDSFEVVSLNGVKGRYVKLVVEKSSFSRWAMIEELYILGK